MSVATTRDEPLVRPEFSGQRFGWRTLPRRMSVRAIMIVILALGGMLGWIVHLAQVQRDAVAAIRSGGGQVTYDWQLKTLPNGSVRFDPTGRPKAPKWLLDYLGDDYFGHVEHVTLGSRNIDAVVKQVGHLDRLRQLTFFTGTDLTPLASAGLDSLPNNGVALFKGVLGLFTTDFSPPLFDGANLKYLKDLTRLEHLNLPDLISLTDADLTYLGGMTALSRLELHDPRITDAGLASLKDMTKLEFLNLFGTHVSATGLKSLGAMTRLKNLNLGGTRVDDLSPICHLTLVTNLDLSNTPIDDKGLAQIAGLVALDHLRLDHTRITDVTLAHLPALPKLQNLVLDGTDITDHGLATLIKCKALKRLHVHETKISPTGLTAFRKARPGVGIMH